MATNHLLLVAVNLIPLVECHGEEMGGIPMLHHRQIFEDEDLLHHPTSEAVDPDGLTIDTMIDLTIVVLLEEVFEDLLLHIEEEGHHHRPEEEEEDHLHHPVVGATAELPFDPLKRNKNGWQNVGANA